MGNRLLAMIAVLVSSERGGALPGQFITHSGSRFKRSRGRLFFGSE